MPRRCYRLSLLLLGLASIASLLPADSIPISWVGLGVGNWGTASNWSPAVVPNNSNGTTYAVSINPFSVFPPVPPSVEVNISPTVDSLDVQASSVTVQSGSTLSVNGALDVNGQIPINAAALVVDAGASLNAGSVSGIANDTSFDISGKANIGSLTTGSPAVMFDLNSGGLVNVGTLNAGGLVEVNGTFNTANPNVNIFDMGISGTFTVGTGNLLPLSSPDTMVNAGSITSDGQGIDVGGPPNEGSMPVFGLQVSPNGTYDEVIGGATSFGTLDSVNPVSLDGTLGITLANSYIPPVGQTFLIIGSDGISGRFSNIEGQTFNNGTEKWDVVYGKPFEPGTLQLVAVATPEPSLFVLAGLGLLGIVWSRRGRPPGGRRYFGAGSTGQLPL
jgi:hypothetical protein